MHRQETAIIISEVSLLLLCNHNSIDLYFATW